MATLASRKNGSRVIQFEDRDRLRRTITLGKIPQRSAQQILIHVEELVAAQYANTAPKPETSRWLATISGKLTDKLAKAGLIETRESATLGAFIDGFLASREADPSIKPLTVTTYKATLKGLREWFGDSRPLRSITKGDARAWRTAITKGKAENTVRKWTAISKTIFNVAVNDELIDANPFDGLPSGLVRIRSRDYFVTREEANKVLEACPSLEWRLIFALARYGGLRCPSEVLALRWGDILWDKNRFIVHSIKTEHHEGHETRLVPLFSELDPLLREAFDTADEGTEYVINRTRDGSANLRTTMQKIIGRAGLKPWPKLFQNLRATRATELADDNPGHVAAAWLGHSVKVAKNSYWQVTDDHFDNAIKKSAALCAAEGARNDSQSIEGKKTNSIDTVVCNVMQALSTCIVAEEGLEPPTRGL